MVSATDPLITLDRIALAPVGQSTSHPPQRRWGDHKSGLEVLDETALKKVQRPVVAGDLRVWVLDEFLFRRGKAERAADRKRAVNAAREFRMEPKQSFNPEAS